MKSSIVCAGPKTIVAKRVSFLEQQLIGLPIESRWFSLKLCIGIYPISYIRYGHIPTWDSPPSHPNPCWGRRRWGRGGGEPLMRILNIGYRILDLLFYIHILICLYIYIYYYTYAYIYTHIYICIAFCLLHITQYVC